MYNLTWQQAVEAMKNGAKITHQYFTSNEFFQMEGGRVVDEAGYSMAGWNRGEDWQQQGFMILEDK